MSTVSSPPHILHSAESVLSRRHVATWLILAFAAGSVNAGAFVVCQRFISHMTGIVTRVGLDAGAWWLMTEYMLVLAAFVLGATASVLPLQGRTLRGKAPIHALSLWVTSLLLVGIAWAGQVGAFGPIGGTLEESGDFVFLAVTAFTMGLLNATVASTTALAVRTTHMTGPATDLGVHLGTALFSAGAERTKALQLAGLRGGKIAAFAVGAAAMLPLMHTAGHAAFAAPAALIAVAATRSYRSSVASPTTAVLIRSTERN